MTTDELAAKRVAEAVATLKRRWADEAVGFDLTTAGDEARRLCAIKAAMADDITIQIQMEINRYD